MSRTFRNRHAVPKGYEVRDGGGLFYPSCCPNKKAQRASWWAIVNPYTDHRCPCHLRWNQSTKFRRGWYRTERKAYRKLDFQQYRNRMKNLMRHERWEEILPYCRTGGRLTW
jgi:hypothetical protein